MTRRARTPAEVVKRHPAGPEHQVVSLKGGGRTWRREPCDGCPWRVDTVGDFPPEAFRVSANTSVDMSTHTFACHESGQTKPATCAGFLLRGADHNLSVRLGWRRGDFVDVVDGGHELHDSYRAMAVANGVDPDDPALANVRP